MSVAMCNNSEVCGALTKLSESVEAIIPKGKSLANANGDIGDLVEQEMVGATRAIEAATQRLQQFMARPHDSTHFSTTDLQVHNSTLAAALAITNAIARLIKAGTDSQQDIVVQGKDANSTQQFYKRNNRWTEGMTLGYSGTENAMRLLNHPGESPVLQTFLIIKSVCSKLHQPLPNACSPLLAVWVVPSP
jgi:huntingtin-interacting protein 1-related protein